MPSPFFCFCFSTSPVVAWSTLKYQTFFPSHYWVTSNISYTTCSATRQAYLQGAALFGPRSSWTITACYNHESCILANTDEAQKNNWASAQVLLGLAPTLLANLGPLPAEIALLSSRRPILSFLLCMGTGTIYPYRVFQYNDPNLLLSGEDSVFSQMGPQPHLKAIAISTGQYLFAVGAVVNTLTLIIELGTNAVEAFDCTSYFYPLVWWLIALLIHLLAAIPFNAVHRGWLQTKDNNAGNGTRSVQGAEPVLSYQREKTISAKKPMGWVRRLVRTRGCVVQWVMHASRSEVTISANRPPPDELLPSALVRFSSYCCGALGSFHIVFGTMIFSSLLFIMYIDALLCIVRLVVSAACCRLILLMEFGGMKSTQQKRFPDRLFTREHLPG